MSGKIKTKRDAGYLLGPLFYEFCCRLHWLTGNYDRKQDALLFMSRGGLRLQYLYELFLNCNDLKSNTDLYPFWISRFAAVKLIFPVNPELAVSHVVREFSYTNCRTMAAALIPDQLYPNKEDLLQTIPDDTGYAPVTRDNFFALFYHSCAYADQLRWHFHQQAEMGNAYLNDKFGQYQKLHTVDTGWFGSTLGSLQSGCGKWKWDAIYFGRWNYRDEVPWYFYDIIPIMIDAVGLKGKNKIDIFLEYHHIIEAVLEPELPSTEYYLPDGSSSSMIPDWEKRIAGDESEEMWMGVIDYFRSKPSTDINDVVKATQNVLKLWKRALRYPTAEEAKILEVPARSADFGKKDQTAIFGQLDHKNRKEYWRCIKRSLWPAGAIAISSSRKSRWFKQLFWHIAKACISYRGAV